MPTADRDARDGASATGAPPDLQRFQVGRFLIFYRPMGDDGIEIVRFVRGGRDLAALFEARVAPGASSTPGW